MDKLIEKARWMDVALGIVFALLAGYFSMTGSNGLALAFVASSLLSFISAVVVPARWLAKRVLGLQLKR